MATNPPAHNRLSFTGTIPGPEIFSFSLCDSSALSPKAAAMAAQGPIQDAFSNGPTNCMADATLTHVICEAIAADGKVSSSYAQATQATQGASLGAKWNVLTQAVTLETDTDNGHGRTVRGRFYPPAYNDGQGAAAAYNATLAYALAWSQFITALNTAGLTICVASATDGGQLARVTACTVDTLLDTQRRRKNRATGQRTPKQNV